MTEKRFSEQAKSLKSRNGLSAPSPCPAGGAGFCGMNAAPPAFVPGAFFFGKREGTV